MQPQVELRWLERWVPDKETDGRHQVQERVLQWRWVEAYGFDDVFDIGPKWTEWQDVPVHVEDEA